MVDIKEIVETKPKTLSDQLYEYSATPYPSLLLSGMLLATPLITSQPQAIAVANASKSGMTKMLGKTKRVGPSPVSSLLFGGAMALGSWIINEGDVESGTGFITAWSSLYLIVNGRATFNGLRYGRVWPVLLTGVAGMNAYLYGKRFFFTSGSV